MLIVVEGDYPVSLFVALHGLMQLYPSGPVEVVRDIDVDEPKDKDIILFTVAWQPKGLEPAIKSHYKHNYRVFAFKHPKDPNFSTFTFSTTVLGLIPALIKAIETDPKPFVYTINPKAKRKKLTKQTVQV